MLNHVDHEERNHYTFRARHEYARMLRFLERTEGGRSTLDQFRRELTQSVEDGDYPFLPLHTQDLDEFLID